MDNHYSLDTHNVQNIYHMRGTDHIACSRNLCGISSDENELPVLHYMAQKR